MLVTGSPGREFRSTYTLVRHGDFRFADRADSLDAARRLGLDDGVVHCFSFFITPKGGDLVFPDHAGSYARPDLNREPSPSEGGALSVCATSVHRSFERGLLGGAEEVRCGPVRRVDDLVGNPSGEPESVDNAGLSALIFEQRHEPFLGNFIERFERRDNADEKPLPARAHRSADRPLVHGERRDAEDAGDVAPTHAVVVKFEDDGSGRGFHEFPSAGRTAVTRIAKWSEAWGLRIRPVGVQTDT